MVGAYWLYFESSSLTLPGGIIHLVPLLLLSGDSVRDKIAKAASEKGQKSAYRNAKRGRMTSRVVLSMLQWVKMQRLGQS